MRKYTSKDLEREFPNDDVCLEWIKDHRWPNGIHCQKCDRVTKHHRVKSRTCFECDYCGTQIYPTAGTIFHKSSTPLKIWFYAIFVMASTRSAVSAKQLEREIGVTYKTAWRMFHQIRKLLDESQNPLSGHVEIDDSYFGGRRPGKRGRGAAGKAVVLGAVERKGRVIAKVVPDVRKATVAPFVQETVARKSTIYTDELQSYHTVRKLGYSHLRIEHSAKVYVRGPIHTNSIEGFWSLVKRGISGVYHSVSSDYLQAYINEYGFRYNHRKDETPMFKLMLGQVRTSLQAVPLCPVADEVHHS